MLVIYLDSQLDSASSPKERPICPISSSSYGEVWHLQKKCLVGQLVTAVERGGTKLKRIQRLRWRDGSITRFTALCGRIHYIIVVISWTGLALWEFELHLPQPYTLHPTFAHCLSLSDTVHSSIGFGKSTHSQTRQPNTLISNSKQQVDDYVWGGGSPKLINKCSM